MTQDINVEHLRDENRFVIRLDGLEAELVYRLPAENEIDFLHTGVPEAFSGQGIGGILANAGLAYAALHKLRVRPYCPFVHSYIRKHSEYRDLVADDFDFEENQE